MRNGLLSIVTIILSVAMLTGCSSPTIQEQTPIVFPTLLPVTPQPSATPAIQVQDIVLPSPTPTIPGASTATSIPDIATFTPDPSLKYTILPGQPSGPYAVLGVTGADVLNIRSTPGNEGDIIGSFISTMVSVMRTGPSAWIEPDLWVEVQMANGGTGWVNSAYLTEYVALTAFCADIRVNGLLSTMGDALRASDGEALSALVSPVHGVEVYLWRNGNPINFDQTAFNWVFVSTWEHNWGSAPGSGLETVGSFHDAVLPKLLEVYNVSYTHKCNDPGIAATFSQEPWPKEYANINYYSLYKPGTPGVDLDWRHWLVGVEYVQGKPYLFALIHFQWEP